MTVHTDALAPNGNRPLADQVAVDKVRHILFHVWYLQVISCHLCEPDDAKLHSTSIGKKHMYQLYMLQCNSMFIWYFASDSSIQKKRLPCGAPSLTAINLLPAQISNYILYDVWNEITCPFPNFNSATFEVLEWISNFIPHFTGHVITHPCWDWS